MKADTIAAIREQLGQVDMMVYSMAAPARTHPKTGETFRSAIKPLGAPVTVKTLNTDKGEVFETELAPATAEETAGTVAVMGGEDWEMWVEALAAAGVLAPGFRTLSYTYIGSELTWPIYWKATLGKAKEDLDRAAAAIRDRLGPEAARVVSLKAVVTQASSAIPVVPLYGVVLFKVMKEMGLHEGCIEQIDRLFRTVSARRSGAGRGRPPAAGRLGAVGAGAGGGDPTLGRESPPRHLAGAGRPGRLPRRFPEDLRFWPARRGLCRRIRSPGGSKARLGADATRTSGCRCGNIRLKAKAPYSRPMKATGGLFACSDFSTTVSTNWRRAPTRGFALRIPITLRRRRASTPPCCPGGSAWSGSAVQVVCEIVSWFVTRAAVSAAEAAGPKPEDGRTTGHLLLTGCIDLDGAGRPPVGQRHGRTGPICAVILWLSVIFFTQTNAYQSPDRVHRRRRPARPGHAHLGDGRAQSPAPADDPGLRPVRPGPDLRHRRRVFRTLTARKTFEDARTRLAASEAQYRVLADNITDIIALNEMGRQPRLCLARRSNPALGYQPEELFDSQFRLRASRTTPSGCRPKSPG